MTPNQALQTRVSVTPAAELGVVDMAVEVDARDLGRIDLVVGQVNLPDLPGATALQMQTWRPRALKRSAIPKLLELTSRMSRSSLVV